MTPLSPAGLLHDLLVPLRLHLHRRDRGIHAPGPGQRSPLITRVEHCVTTLHPSPGLLLPVRRVHADDQDLGLYRPHHLLLAQHPGV